MRISLRLSAAPMGLDLLGIETSLKDCDRTNFYEVSKKWPQEHSGQLEGGAVVCLSQLPPIQTEQQKVQIQTKEPVYLVIQGPKPPIPEPIQWFRLSDAWILF